MNLALDSYNWRMYISQSLPQGLNTSMTVEDIIKENKQSSEVKKIVTDVASKNLSRFIRVMTSDISVNKKFNFQDEISYSIRLFSRHLKMRLKNSKLLNIKEPMKVHILFAPQNRRMTQVDKVKGILNNDRFVLFSEDIEAHQGRFNEDVVKLTQEAMSTLNTKAIRCKSSGVFLQTALFSVQINPQIDDSTVLTQISMGLPLGINYPFEQKNDQIAFQTILMPEKITKEQADQYPSVNLTVVSKLNSPEVNMLFQFGSQQLPTAKDLKLEKAAEISRSTIPKLRGRPVGFLKSFLNVDFSIYNLATQLDLSKYKQDDLLELNELNLYISAGFNSLPNLKFGMINKEEVDSLFETEINKTIKTEMQKQRKELTSKVDTISVNKTGLTTQEVIQLIKTIFQGKE